MLLAMAHLFYQYIEEYNILIDHRGVYEELTNERELLIAKFERYAIDFSVRQEQINSEEDLVKKSTLLAETLSDARSQYSTIREAIVIDQKLLDLNLNDEEKEIVQEIYELDLLNAELYSYYVDTLELEIKVIGYNTDVNTSNNCLTSIDFNQSNEIIATSISDCMDELDRSYTRALALGENFPDTILYMSHTKSYWETTRQIYEALASEQRESAATLRETQRQLEASVDEYSPKSAKEIELELNRRVATISALEKRIQP